MGKVFLLMGINEMGFEVFEEMLDYGDELQIEVYELENGTVVIDVRSEGSGRNRSRHLLSACA